MSHTTFVAIAHDGTVHVRSSKTMQYVEAVMIRSADGSTGPASWHQSREATRKALRTVERRVAGRPGTRVYIVDVTGYPYSSPEAKRARNGENPEPQAPAEDTPANPELVAKTIFRLEHIATDPRRWEELTDAERADYYRAAGYEPPAVEDAPQQLTIDTVEDDADEDQDDTRDTHTLIIVPCADRKVDHAAPARDLYDSANFRHTLRAAESEAAATERDLRTPCRVVILSAKYGLLELDDVVEPYDVTMTDADSVDALEVADQLRALEPDTVVMMLPAAYRDRMSAAVDLVHEITDGWIHQYDAYETAPGIGYQRGTASAILRHSHAAFHTDQEETMKPAPTVDLYVVDAQTRRPFRVETVHGFSSAHGHDYVHATVEDGRRVTCVTDEAFTRPATDPYTREDRDDRARQLRELPVGTYVAAGPWTEYRKTPRGDWASVSSTPDRFTSAELATIGVDPATARCA